MGDVATVKRGSEPDQDVEYPEPRRYGPEDKLVPARVLDFLESRATFGCVLVYHAYHVRVAPLCQSNHDVISSWFRGVYWLSS
jgi:hypothetical protein